MKIRELYEKAIAKGIELDPRGADEVRKELEREKKDFEGLRDKDKRFFDKDKLSNPYADSRIL